MAATDPEFRAAKLAEAERSLRAAEFQWRQASVLFVDCPSRAQRVRNAYIDALNEYRRAKEAFDEADV